MLASAIRVESSLEQAMATQHSVIAAAVDNPCSSILYYIVCK